MKKFSLSKKYLSKFLKKGDFERSFQKICFKSIFHKLNGKKTFLKNIYTSFQDDVTKNTLSVFYVPHYRIFASYLAHIDLKNNNESFYFVNWDADKDDIIDYLSYYLQMKSCFYSVPRQSILL